MLEITIPATEKWDAVKREFIYTKEYTLKLEHSLVSISKWESNWCKPFLSKTPKNHEESVDYIKCMTITQNVPNEAFENITKDIVDMVNDYIDKPMTATWFSEKDKGRTNNEVITNELIYYWMISHGIPVEFQKWHLNRLLTLIQVCNAKNGPQKKMSSMDTMKHYARINAMRRNQLGSKG